MRKPNRIPTYPFNMRIPAPLLEKLKVDAIKNGITYTAMAKMIMTNYYNQKENNKKDICE